MFKELVYYRLLKMKRLVVFDAPLLFETKLLEYFCFPIITVACSEENELQRLMKRDNLAKEDAEKRIKSQMGIQVALSSFPSSGRYYIHGRTLVCKQDKVKRSDLVIVNDASLEQLVAEAHNTLSVAGVLVGATAEVRL